MPGVVGQVEPALATGLTDIGKLLAHQALCALQVSLEEFLPGPALATAGAGVAVVEVSAAHMGLQDVLLH